MSRAVCIAVLLVLGGWGQPRLASTCRAGHWVYSKIADSQTPSPIGGTFGLFFGGEPILDGERIIFSNEGVFAYQAGFDTLIDPQAPIPGETGTFQGGQILSVDHGVIAFSGFGADGQEGIYRLQSGVIDRIVDQNTPIPSGVGNFTSVRGFESYLPSIRGERIAFVGRGSGGQWGVYEWDQGVLSRVVDSSMPIPGGTGNFERFDSPVLDDAGRVMFFGRSADRNGLYVADGQGLHTIADTDDIVPRDGFPPTQLTDVGQHGWVGDAVVFQGAGAGSGSLVLARPGQPLEQLLYVNTPVKDHPFTRYSSLYGLAFDQTGVAAAVSTYGGSSAILRWDGSEWEQVVGPGDDLLGLIVPSDVGAPPPEPYLNFSVGPQSLDGRTIVFKATILSSTDYQTAIYKAVFVPEPAAGCLLVAGIGLLAVRCAWQGSRRRC